MEPRPKDKMPPNPIQPIVRAIVCGALVDGDVSYADALRLSGLIAERLCETIDMDGWDTCDRVRRAATKLTWGHDDIDHTF